MPSEELLVDLLEFISASNGIDGGTGDYYIILQYISDISSSLPIR